MKTLSKKCSLCNEKKSLEDFYKSRQQCKKCFRQNTLAFKRTMHGLVCAIFGNQRRKSRERNHPAPTYTLAELREWCFSRPRFHALFAAWEASGFKKDLKPSLDRLDDYKSYSFENIQLITWGENNKKGNYDKRRGKNNKHNRGVAQITESGHLVRIFHSAAKAARITGIRAGGIGECCRKYRGKISAGGFLWKFTKQQ